MAFRTINTHLPFQASTSGQQDVLGSRPYDEALSQDHSYDTASHTRDTLGSPSAAAGLQSGLGEPRLRPLQRAESYEKSGEAPRVPPSLPSQCLTLEGLNAADGACSTGGAPPPSQMVLNLLHENTDRLFALGDVLPHNTLVTLEPGVAQESIGSWQAIACSTGIIYFTKKSLLGAGTGGQCFAAIFKSFDGAMRNMCVKHFSSENLFGARLEYDAGQHVYDAKNFFFVTPAQESYLITDRALGALNKMRLVSKDREAAFIVALRGVLTDLEKLHRQGMLHKDIKTANMFVFQTSSGYGVGLRDFDCAGPGVDNANMSNLEVAPEDAMPDRCLTKPATMQTWMKSEVFSVTKQLLGTVGNIPGLPASDLSDYSDSNFKLTIEYYERLRKMEKPAHETYAHLDDAEIVQIFWRRIDAYHPRVAQIVRGLLAFYPEDRLSASDALAALNGIAAEQQSTIAPVRDYGDVVWVTARPNATDAIWEAESAHLTSRHRRHAPAQHRTGSEHAIAYGLLSDRPTGIKKPPLSADRGLFRQLRNVFRSRSLAAIGLSAAFVFWLGVTYSGVCHPFLVFRASKLTQTMSLI